MSTPKLRIIAGPNGSGKSTLFQRLSQSQHFPWGYCVNADEIDRELKESGRVYLGGFGQIDELRLISFLRDHPLAANSDVMFEVLNQNTVVVRAGTGHEYFGAILCDYLRSGFLARHESFTFETVMSHPDKIGLMHNALAMNYRTYLYYVCTTKLLNPQRVASRVALGGHDVAEGKINERYERSLALLPAAIAASSRAFIFDNSASSHRLIAEYESGVIVSISGDLPRWFAEKMLPSKSNP